MMSRRKAWLVASLSLFLFSVVLMTGFAVAQVQKWTLAAGPRESDFFGAKHVERDSITVFQNNFAWAISPEEEPAVIDAWQKAKIDWHDVVVAPPPTGNEAMDRRNLARAEQWVTQKLTQYDAERSLQWGTDHGPLAAYHVRSDHKSLCIRRSRAVVLV